MRNFRCCANLYYPSLKATKKQLAYLISVDRKKGRKLKMQVHDSDKPDELELFLDGEFLKHAPKSGKNQWQADTLKLKGEKQPKLVELEVKSTNKKDEWGSRLASWK